MNLEFVLFIKQRFRTAASLVKSHGDADAETENSGGLQRLDMSIRIGVRQDERVGL